QNRFTQRGGVVLAAGTLRHQRKGRVRADGPILALLKLVERLARHEQDDLAVMSHAEREANRGRRDAVVVNRLAADPQHTFAIFSCDPGTALGHSPKYQYARGLVGQLLVLRVERIEARNSPVGARINLRLGTGEGRAARKKSERHEA